MIFALLSGGAVSHAHAKTATSILLFGDSIIAGYGLPEEDSLAVRLESFFVENEQIIAVENGGVSGDTTNAGLTRLEWMLKRTKPDIVFLALGGNDVLRGIPPAFTRKNLDSMLAILQKRNIKTVFSKVQAPSNLGADYTAELDTAFVELAEKYNVPLYPFLLESTFTNSTLMLGDGIHPNAKGVQKISQELGAYLLDFRSE
jgi:acyl-CoA thioesterase-1